MRRLFVKLWRDDAGFVVSTELVFVATLLVLGITVGLAGLRNAVNNELEELANAIMSLSQAYSFSGQSNCIASSAGSATTDTCDTIPIGNPAATVCDVDGSPCD